MPRTASGAGRGRTGSRVRSIDREGRGPHLGAARRGAAHIRGKHRARSRRDRRRDRRRGARRVHAAAATGSARGLDLRYQHVWCGQRGRVRIRDDDRDGHRSGHADRRSLSRHREQDHRGRAGRSRRVPDADRAHHDHRPSAVGLARARPRGRLGRRHDEGRRPVERARREGHGPALAARPRGGGDRDAASAPAARARPRRQRRHHEGGHHRAARRGPRLEGARGGQGSGQGRDRAVRRRDARVRREPRPRRDWLRPDRRLPVQGGLRGGQARRGRHADAVGDRAFARHAPRRRDGLRRGRAEDPRRGGHGRGCGAARSARAPGTGLDPPPPRRSAATRRRVRQRDRRAPRQGQARRAGRDRRPPRFVGRRPGRA